MKTIKLLGFFLFLSSLLYAQTPDFVDHQIIAKLSNDVTISFEKHIATINHPDIKHLNTSFQLAKIERLIKSKSNTPKKNRPDTDRLLLFSFQNDIDVLEVIKAYQALEIFEYVEPNYIGRIAGVANLTPDDDFYSTRQWALNNDGTFNSNPLSGISMGSSQSGADINIEPAWDLTTGNPDIVVAILDSGFRLSHPELQGRIWNNTNETQSNNQDDDNNGFIDDNVGWDFVNSDNIPADDHGHGTNVAGIALATGNNGIGYAGVDWQSQLMVCKIINENNTGTYANFAAAVYYAVDNGADVINMSVGGSGNSAVLLGACAYAHDNDVPVFACMMNVNSSVPYYPAAFTSTIAVGSTNADDSRTDPFFWSTTSGSNYGAHIDIVAPGNFMYGLNYNSNTNYNSYWGGTSQASPLAAGVGALIKGINPNFTVEEIRSFLRSTADDEVGNPLEDIAGWDQYHGAGRLNAYEAIVAAGGVVNIKETISDIQLVALSPNPVLKNSPLNLHLVSEIDRHFSCIIYDALGNRLRSFQLSFNENKETFQAPSEAGVYFLKIKTDRDLFQTKKFIVLD